MSDTPAVAVRVPVASETHPRALASVTAAIVLWTTNVFFVRRAGDVAAFTAWRMLFALPVLAVTAAGTRVGATAGVRPAVRRAALGASTWVVIAAIGVLFGAAAYVNFTAFNRTTLVNVGAIHALQPAVVAMIAGRYLGEYADWRLIAQTGIAVAGAMLVAAASTGQGTWSLEGDLLAVLGLGMNTVWFMAGRWVRTRTDLDATTYMLAVFTAGAAASIVIALAAGGLGVTTATVVYAALTAVFGTIGHTLVAWAHRFVPAAVSSVFLLSQPVLIAALAWVAFDETLSLLHAAGGALVLGSLVTIVLRGRTAALA